MTQLPGTNYMSNAARTDAEMQVALDKVNEVIAEIGSKEAVVSTLATGVLATPLSSMVCVNSEGGASTPDTLLSIGVSNITQGRIVILKNENAGSTATTGAYITITHGTGAEAVEMLDGENFILCSRRQLALVYTGNRWVEVWRTYGRNTADEKLAERTDIGLGDASVETIATGSVGGANSKVLKVGAAANIPTDGLLAIDSSGNIKAGSVTGGNADTLDSLGSASFVRSDEGAAQTINDSLTLTSAGDTTLVINDTAGTNSPAVAFNHGANERASIFYNSADGSSEWVTKDVSGTTTESVRLDPATNKFEFSVDGSTWQSLTPGAGNGLNADLLDGNEWSNVELTAAQSFRRIYFHDGTQTNFADVSVGGTPITRFTSMAYPVPPNGVRRFMVNARFIFFTTGGDDFDRRVDSRFYSATDGGVSRTGEMTNTLRQTNTFNDNTYYIATVRDVFVRPGVGESVTVRCGEYGDNQYMDMWSDYGVGELWGGTTSSTTTSSSRGRNFVELTYVDEG